MTMDPDQIVSAVLAAGVAACFAYGYLAGRDAGPARGVATVPASSDLDDRGKPAHARHCASARHPRTGRPHADRPRGTARPRAPRRPQRRTSRNL